MGEAKSKLTKIMAEAKSGSPQLVGVRDPVVVVGMSALEDLVMRLGEPETWGEHFATDFDDHEDNIDLVFESRPGTAQFSFDEEDSDSEADEALDADLEMAEDYLNAGDSDAAKQVLTFVRSGPAPNIHEYWQKAQSLQKELITETELLRRYLEAHPPGSLVKCTVLDAARNRVVLQAGKDIKGVAFSSAKRFQTLKTGETVQATVVSSGRKKDKLLLSLNDLSTAHAATVAAQHYESGAT